MAGKQSFELNVPTGVYGRDQSIFIADSGNHRIIQKTRYNLNCEIYVPSSNTCQNIILLLLFSV